MSAFATTVMWTAIGLAVLAALAYLLFRRRAALPPPLPYVPESTADPVRRLFAAADGEPPTEDAIAQARLGGPRGAVELGAAPLVPNERAQMPRPIDDGHTA